MLGLCCWPPAAFLSIAMGYIGLPQAVAAWIAALGLEPLALIALLFLALLILGCFLDGTSILIMTLPITVPLITAAGFDKVWFGIFLVLAIEARPDHAADRLQPLRHPGPDRDPDHPGRVVRAAVLRRVRPVHGRRSS